MTKNIDIPVLKQRIMWTAIMSLIAILLIMSVQRKVNSNINNLTVKIKPIKGNKNLINEIDIKNLFNKYLGYDVTQAEVKSIETNELEELLKADKRIKKVEVFLDAKNKLNVWIVQKQPILRVMDGSNKSYYLDDEGEPIPTVDKSAIRVPLATGNFELYQPGIFQSEKPSKLKEVFEVSKEIFNDEFLSALVEQIDVDEVGEIILIPKIGRQEIIVGDDRNLQEKFANLKIFYKDGLPREGWRKFSALKLNYKGQVIGKRTQTDFLN
jgi:cell division protein FtsQ